VFIGLGIRKLSMASLAVPRIKKLITALTISNAGMLAQQVLAQSTAEDVEQVLSDGLKGLI
jgi:phosphotransferase system enzyme I (PtsI)